MIHRIWLAKLFITVLMVSSASVPMAIATETGTGTETSPKPSPSSKLMTAEGQLQFGWLGVAGVFLTDGRTQLFFDPVFTFPTFKHWLWGAELKSDPNQVQGILNQVGVNPKLPTALFVSHTHFDHASDYQEVAKLTKGQVYGGPSLQTMTQPPVAFRLIKEGDVIRVGDFEITVFNHVHARILSLFHFLFGPVKEPFTSGFYEFREGETWGFVIQHRNRLMIFDQSSRLDENYLKYKRKIHTYFVGVNNRVSTADWVRNTIGRVEPSQVVPLHFDFFPLEYFKDSMFPFIDIEGVEAKLKSDFPKVKWIMPRKFSMMQLQD